MKRSTRKPATKRKQFRFYCLVESVEGWQSWLVEADSESEARAKYERGESEFEAEDLNVMSLGEPEISEVEDG